MLIIFIVERWFWEFKMLFGSLVELHVWLHSCICFSPLWKKKKKTIFQAISTAPRHLSIPSLSIEPSVVFLSQSRHLSITRWINRESICPLNSSSIHRACFAMDTSRHLLNSWIYQNFFKARYLLTPAICRELLNPYIKGQCNSVFIFLDLSRSVYVLSPPKSLSLSLSHSKPLTHMFFGLCVISLHLVCLFFTHPSCITCFWPNFLGFCWKFGVSQNC